MAHSYSTDSAERRYIPFFIAASAIGATFLVFHFLEKNAIAIPWWASPPIDTMAFYGFFYWIFDKRLWRWKFIHRLGITRIPDLSGEWTGQVNPTSSDGVSKGLGLPADVTLSIQQTWTTLIIAAETGHSRSHSISGTITVDDDRVVSYEYINEPLAGAPSSMHAHRGVARFILNADATVLEGEYYSGRDRQNVGTIRVVRKKA